MKSEQKRNAGATPSKRAKDPARQKTDVPGQNPKQNDAPDHDMHHDESRENPKEKRPGG